MLRSTETVLKADSKKKINMYFFSGKFEKILYLWMIALIYQIFWCPKHPEHQSVNLYILPFYSVLRAEHIFIRLDKPSRKYYFIFLVATLHKVTISDRKVLEMWNCFQNIIKYCWREGLFIDLTWLMISHWNISFFATEIFHWLVVLMVFSTNNPWLEERYDLKRKL